MDSITLRQAITEFGATVLELVTIGCARALAHKEVADTDIASEIVSSFAWRFEEILEVCSQPRVPQEKSCKYVVGYVVETVSVSRVSESELLAWVCAEAKDGEQAERLFCQTHRSSMEKRHVVQWVATI